MKSSFYPAILLGFTGILLNHCVTYSVKKSDIVGPTPRGAVNLTESQDNGTLKIKPYFEFSADKSMQFKDDDSYTDTSNVFWKSENNTYGVNTEINLTDYINLEYGFMASEVENEYFYSHLVGMGVRGVFLSKFGLRLDNSVLVYRQKFNSLIIESDDADEDREISEIGDETYLGMNTKVTANTLKQWLGMQYFISSEIGYYKYFFSDHSYLGASFGVYKNIFNRMNVISSINYQYYDSYAGYVYKSPHQFSGSVGFEYSFKNLLGP